MLVNGFGSGLFQPPNTSAIMASFPFKRRGVAFVFIISSLLTVPAIIVSAMRGRDDAGRNREMTAKKIKND